MIKRSKGDEKQSTSLYARVDQGVVSSSSSLVSPDVADVFFGRGRAKHLPRWKSLSERDGDNRDDD